MFVVLVEEEGSQRALGVAFSSNRWLPRHTNRESSGREKVIDSVPERPYHYQWLRMARSSDTRNSIWEMLAQKAHQRTPLILGNKAEVEETVAITQGG